MLRVCECTKSASTSGGLPHERCPPMSECLRCHDVVEASACATLPAPACCSANVTVSRSSTVYGCVACVRSDRIRTSVRSGCADSEHMGVKAWRLAALLRVRPLLSQQQQVRVLLQSACFERSESVTVYPLSCVCFCHSAELLRIACKGKCNAKSHHRVPTPTGACFGQLANARRCSMSSCGVCIGATCEAA